MTVLKIQPGPSDGYDTWIDEANPDTNYQSDGYLGVRSLQGTQRQALINFFFGALPADALVIKAELYLYVMGQSGCQDLYCYKASYVWYVDEVTWNLRPPIATPKRIASAGSGEWVKFDVLDIVQGWITNPNSNLGFQLLSTLCAQSLFGFYSADYMDDPTKRPYLEITYIPNGAQPCWPAAHSYTHIETGDDPIDEATVLIDGLMSAADKRTLAGLTLNGLMDFYNLHPEYDLLNITGDQADAAITALDRGYAKKIITWAGNAQVDTAQKKFGQSSLLFEGNGDYITVPYSTNFQLDTDFTIDFWGRFNVITGGTFCGSQLGGWASVWVFYYDGAGKMRFFWQTPTSFVEWSWTPSQNIWYHIAVTREGNNWKLYIDGVQTGGTQVNAANPNFPDAPFMIGGDGFWQYHNGWIQNFRFVKRVRWTTNFTPPIA